MGLNATADIFLILLSLPFYLQYIVHCGACGPWLQVPEHVDASISISQTPATLSEATFARRLPNAHQTPQDIHLGTLRKVGGFILREAPTVLLLLARSYTDGAGVHTQGKAIAALQSLAFCGAFGRDKLPLTTLSGQPLSHKKRALYRTTL